MAVIASAGLRQPKVPGAAHLKRPLLAPETSAQPASATPETKTRPRPKKRASIARRQAPSGAAPTPRRSPADGDPWRPPAGITPSPKRRGNAQTVLSLPSETWDAIDACSTQSGTRPGALLGELLRQRGPETPREAGQLLSDFLAGARPPGAKEDRNIRLPAETRNRLDAHRDALRAAGLHEATRSGLLLAVWAIRGPKNAEDAGELINAGRLAALEQLQ